MRWLYKIWSGYDGFRPSRIPDRLQPGGEIGLGWARYADVAEPGDEVWVWFYGPGKFQPGVYIKGIAESIDPVARQLILQTQEWQASTPLTTAAENVTLAAALSPGGGRQVFVLPEDFRRFDDCTATMPKATSCASRKCDYCTYWGNLPAIKKEHVRTPSLLDGAVLDFAPGYWVIATRSFVWSQSARQRPGIRKTTNMFYRFKTGEAALAYPLAKGMVTALAKRGLIEADAVVPIPLSPEKVAKEIHRTRLLSDALSQLIGVPMIDALTLTGSKGKRASQNAGETPQKFRKDYAALLAVDAPSLTGLKRIILVDDVCTHGNTLAASISAMRAAGISADIVASTAGQMTVLDAVRNDSGVLKPA